MKIRSGFVSNSSSSSFLIYGAEIDKADIIEATKKAHNDLFSAKSDVFKQIDDNLQFFEISYVENPPDPNCIIKDLNCSKK